MAKDRKLFNIRVYSQWISNKETPAFVNFWVFFSLLCYLRQMSWCMFYDFAIFHKKKNWISNILSHLRVSLPQVEFYRLQWCFSNNSPPSISIGSYLLQACPFCCYLPYSSVCLFILHPALCVAGCFFPSQLISSHHTTSFFFSPQCLPGCHVTQGLQLLFYWHPYLLCSLCMRCSISYCSIISLGLHCISGVPQWGSSIDKQTERLK